MQETSGSELSSFVFESFDEIETKCKTYTRRFIPFKPSKCTQMCSKKLFKILYYFRDPEKDSDPMASF